MPKLSDTMEEGKILKWFKREGDPVEKGEKIFEVETDKADMEVESFDSGTLSQILLKEGQTAPVGTPIARLAAPGEKVEAAPPPVAEKVEVGVRASPLARRVAEELRVDLTKVKGTGPEGRITKEDVEAAAQEVRREVVEAAPEVELEELSSMRKAIAKTVIQSKTEIPHFYVTVAVDMTEAVKIKKSLEDSYRTAGRKLTYTHLIIKAAAMNIQKFPDFNWFYRDGKVQKNKDINIGVAVAVEDGLLIPVIKHCEKLSLEEIADQENQLVVKARSGLLMAGDLTGGTFTISNVGMLDVEHFQAIIYPPQSAILAVSSIKDKSVVKDDQIVVAKIMNVTISVDHRILDGALAAQFLDELKKILENPTTLVS
jgi:pyruvate dehydrogenase E2 component (dihydrolipoamide acetyltransferase)